ncbi:MAG: tryptophan-rich sensory protein [Alphaproteobacteria bacterium]|nr:MAG: tryptophan-rich sensory protein [Alphaproteobacteria bacterium]
MLLELNTIFKYALALLVVMAPAIWILFSYGPKQTNRKTEQWFESLEKPSYTPSKELFSFLWLLTYAIMGIAGFMVFEYLRIYKFSAVSALTVFTVKYVLGISLFPIFFGLKDLTLSGFLISALLPMIFWTMVEFYKLSTTSLILMLPYAAWIGFLTVLTFDLIELNPDQIDEENRRTNKTLNKSQRLPNAKPPIISQMV